MANRTAFVLGNGTSRKEINNQKLKNYGVVYGCNALYREFAPDHLVCVDTKMITEINDAQYQHKHNVWSNRNKLTERTPNVKIMDPNKGWSSGPTALLLASQHGYKTIYILGFDYVGIGEDKEFVNNIYAGSKNYKGTKDRATYYGNWQRQTMMCINQFPKTKYYRILKSMNDYIPDHLKDLTNLSHITVDDFAKNFQ
jgi:hypothetical protein